MENINTQFDELKTPFETTANYGKIFFIADASESNVFI